jgi:transposase
MRSQGGELRRINGENLEVEAMSKPLIDDELWALIEPILPPPKPRRFRYPGRQPLSDRAVLNGIIFVLKTGINWNDLPAELEWGCGKVCRQRLRAWHEAGVWVALHAVLLAELHCADKIDWSRATVDSSRIRALNGGDKTGPSPTDRSKKGSKHHVLTDAKGTPLAAKLTGANRNDITQLIDLVDAVSPVTGKPGRPRQRPRSLYGDRAYDSKRHRQELRARGIAPKIARRGEPHGSGLGVFRYVAEQVQAWLHGFKRLRIRYERTAFMHEAFLSLACCLICFRHL